ncbi:MAG: hypothetical protein IJJ41_04960 [Clostridia bacterium]|nr:hypothetical protein [Clostridia bacterium]
MKQKRQKKNRGPMLALIGVFAAILALTGGIIYFQVSRKPQAHTTTTAAAVSENSAQSAPLQNTQGTDAATYYSQNAQKLLSVIPADSSKAVFSEQKIGEELTARGFGKNAPITYEYGMDGSYEEKTPVDNSSLDKHPQYTVVYMAQSGDYWTITVSNGSVTAYPVSYNLEHNSGAEVILAETDSVTAYDNQTNSFYELIPKPSVLVLKQIPAITAEALERLTAEEIDKL